MNKKTVDTIYYFDYAAATPTDPAVEKAMRTFATKCYGNASSLHRQGQAAKAALAKSRSKIAALLSARPEEVVFTAGGTESCNLAILGAAKALGAKKGHFITSAVEHPAVLEPFAELEKWGHEVTYLKTDGQGLVDIRDIERALRPNTVLVSIMYANNEIGTIEPIAEIGRLLNKVSAERRTKQPGAKILFHTDACQAAGLCELSVNRLGVDLMSLNGSKLYGPKQSGLLYVRAGTKLEPLLLGGGQERGLRSGTENVAAAVGLAKALDLTRQTWIKEVRRLGSLSLKLHQLLTARVPRLVLNGPAVGSDFRLPNNLNYTLPGVEGETMLLYLDAHGICVSTGSACSSSEDKPSHVLKAIGVPVKATRNNLRITLVRQTTAAQLAYFANVFPSVLKKIQATVNQV